MVYDTSSASDVATTKAEASSNGWGASVSGEFAKTESSAASASSIYFDYWRKKVYNPDPSNIVEFGLPLSADFKAELRAAYANNQMDGFYQKWGNFVVFGLTRGKLRSTSQAHRHIVWFDSALRGTPAVGWCASGPCQLTAPRECQLTRSLAHVFCPVPALTSGPFLHKDLHALPVRFKV